jgi:hypothetical protein
MVMVPAGGTVTVKGKPLAKAVVTFLPPNGPAVGVGETDVQGHFKLSSMGREGIPSGRYKVAVSYLVSDQGVPQGLGARSALAAGPGMLSAKEQIPAEFSDLGRTTLSAEVTPQGGSFPLDIPVDLTIPELKPADEKDKVADHEVPQAKTGEPKSAAKAADVKPAANSAEPKNK